MDEAGQPSPAQWPRRSGGARPAQCGRRAPSRVQRGGSPEGLEALRPSLVDKLRGRWQLYRRMEREQIEGLKEEEGGGGAENGHHLRALSRYDPTKVNFACHRSAYLRRGSASERRPNKGVAWPTARHSKGTGSGSGSGTGMRSGGEIPCEISRGISEAAHPARPRLVGEHKRKASRLC